MLSQLSPGFCTSIDHSLVMSADSVLPQCGQCLAAVLYTVPCMGTG